MNLSYGMIIFQVHWEHTAQLDLERSVEINFIIVVLGSIYSISLMEFFTFFPYTKEKRVMVQKSPGLVLRQSYFWHSINSLRGSWKGWRWRLQVYTTGFIKFLNSYVFLIMLMVSKAAQSSAIIALLGLYTWSWLPVAHQSPPYTSVTCIRGILWCIMPVCWGGYAILPCLPSVLNSFKGAYLYRRSWTTKYYISQTSLHPEFQMLFRSHI